jgi:hypothetical protein
MSAQGTKTGKGAIELCEEATVLLRCAPMETWSYYFAGTLPMVLGLLYFWSDMTRGQQAGDRLVTGSLLLSALFIWMKAWQVLFAARLREVITDVEPEQFSVRGFLRIAVEQARWQPWGLILLPISAVLAFPMAWVYAYYQNLVAVGIKSARPSSEVANQSVHSAAVAQAKLWPQQNHIILLTISGLFLFVFLNVAIALVLVPKLLVMLFGIRELFEPGIWLVLNTTFLAVVGAITHLIMDPFIKAVYVLRCFYGESQTTGEDLRVRMNRAATLRRTAAQAALVCLLLNCLPTAHAAEESAELDQAITEVLTQPEYKWKLPREIPVEENRGLIAEFFAKITDAVGRWLRVVLHWIGDILDWIGRKLRGSGPSEAGSWGFGDPKVLLYICLAFVAVLLVVIVVRNRKSFQRRKELVIAEPVPSIPDLRDENVAADALPEDEWLKLAEEMRAAGDLRLAIRALFLAALSELARRQVVQIAKFKSNRDYQREITRRSAAVPQRASAFSGMVSIYERVWYGLYEPSGSMFSECEESVRLLRTC